LEKKNNECRDKDGRTKILGRNNEESNRNRDEELHSIIEYLKREMGEEGNQRFYLKKREGKLMPEIINGIDFMQRMVYKKIILNLIMKEIIYQVAPRINKLILYFGVKKYILLPEEVAIEKVIKMQQEYPAKSKF
jgi:hypothetical protein